VDIKKKCFEQILFEKPKNLFRTIESKPAESIYNYKLNIGITWYYYSVLSSLASGWLFFFVP